MRVRYSVDAEKRKVLHVIAVAPRRSRVQLPLFSSLHFFPEPRGALYCVYAIRISVGPLFLSSSIAHGASDERKSHFRNWVSFPSLRARMKTRKLPSTKKEDTFLCSITKWLVCGPYRTKALSTIDIFISLEAFCLKRSSSFHSFDSFTEIYSRLNHSR